jgi:cholesterol oxidase
MEETHFDAIVVGSGFGGSVAAYRLAEAGLRVCLLERGKVYPPGSFPRRPAEMRTNFWDPSAGLHGLFDVWSFGGFESIVSSGLGGGSLIYANVLLRKDEHWFVSDRTPAGGYEHWPVSREDLDKHYTHVEDMIAPKPFPFDRPPYRHVAKTAAMQQAAGTLGWDWQLPNLAVTFGNPDQDPVPGATIEEAEPNLHGRARYACMLCGECDIGCNYGSKNTLDYTYLSAAKRLGADLRSRCEVRSFRPFDGGGYEVDYVWHDPAAEGQRTDTKRLPLTTLTTDRLVLSAGAYGTTYLLLKNREAFPHLSGLLGTRFSGNGDLLTFVLPGKAAPPGTARRLNGSHGPVITSAIRFPDAADGVEGAGRGYYVEDGGYPQFVDWLLETQDAPGTAVRMLRFAVRRLLRSIRGGQKSDLGAQVAELLGDCRRSTGSLPMLAMGRDVPDGRMTLRGGWLDVDWTTRSSVVYFDRVRATMRQLATAIGGVHADNPIWYLRRVVTVHPLGGCPMGEHERDGVVSPYGEVFNYPGLYVADGSVMPGPVGPNPALTIAALADRFAEQMVKPVAR